MSNFDTYFDISGQDVDSIDLPGSGHGNEALERALVRHDEGQVSGSTTEKNSRLFSDLQRSESNVSNLSRRAKSKFLF
jgi:hypothetical protein